jgi:hypothetical protein
MPEGGSDNEDGVDVGCHGGDRDVADVLIVLVRFGWLLDLKKTLMADGPSLTKEFTCTYTPFLRRT